MIQGVWALAAVLCGAMPASPAEAPAGESQVLAGSLTGRWQLNRAESEDARAKMDEARKARSGGSSAPGGFGGRMGGGGHSGGYHGHGGHRGGSQGEQAGEDRSMAARQEFLAAPETLTITGNDAEMTVDAGDGQLLRLPVDGRSHAREGDGTETTARWSGSALEVKSKAATGGTLTATYRLVPDARKLEVSSVLSGRSGSPVSVRRVYDAAPAR